MKYILLKPLLVLLCVGLFLPGQAQQIDQLEYFYDSDPGYGNGTAISLSPSAKIDTTLNLSTGGLQNGPHQLFVRAQDSAGHWSLAHHAQFYLIQTASLNPFALDRIEYFIDDDPGYGNATSILLNSANTVDSTFNIPLSGLDAGIHRLFVRTRNVAGFWSLNHFQTFFHYPSATANLLQVRRIEYFFDTDPGFGAATPIPISPDTSVDVMANIDISGLAPGVHHLNIRAQGSNGFWSLIETRPFLKGTTSAFQSPNRIEEIEYFFDSDPGYGNGNAITITPDTTIDIMHVLDLSSLPPGMHTLMLRARGSSGFWSLVNSSPFMLFQGDTSFARIVEAEYFYDQDPGYGNGTAIPLDSLTSVDTTLVLSTTGLSQDTHRVFIRVRDNMNRWSLIQNFKTCYPGEPTAGFEEVRYGPTVSFSDTSDLADRYLWDFGDGSTDTVSHPLHEYQPGNYLVMQIVSNFCGIDTVVHPLIIQGVETFSPNVGGNIGDVRVDVYGGGFDTLTGMRLKRSGYADIVPTDTIFVHGERFTSTLDLRGKALGFWDVRVEYGNGDTVVFPGGFEIQPGTFPNPQANIIGPSVIRPGRWIDYTIQVSNDANVEATGVPVWFAVDRDAEVEILFELLLSDSTYFDFDTISPWVLIDTLYGEPFEAKMYSLFVPFVRANSSTDFDIRIKYNSAGTQTMAAWAHAPFYGSPFSPFVPPCIDGAFDFTMSLFSIANPLGGCVYSFLSVQLDPFAIDPEGSDGKAAFNFAFGVLNTLVSCASLANPVGIAFNTVKNLVTYGSAIQIGNKMACCFQNCENPVAPPPSSTDSLRPPPLPPIPVLKKPVEVVNSYDPNDKLGPLGPGQPQYINESHYFRYMIRFENVDSATAAAQVATVCDTLDPAVFDLNTFALESFKIGDSLYRIPSERQSWTQDIPLDSMPGTYLRVNAIFHPQTGIARWEFLTMDSATNDITQNPLAGFLPPNLFPPAGEGAVAFSIQQKDSLDHGTHFKNTAAIVFDINPPIVTNQWENTLDTLSPVTVMNTIPAVQYDSLVQLNWSGSDSGSGVAYYNLYMAKNNSNFDLLAYFYRDTAYTFTAEADSLYQFFCEAVDSVNNREVKPPAAEITFQYIDTCTYIYTQVDTSICPGESFDGYTLAGMYVDSFASPNACDSIRTLNLGVWPVPQTPSVTQISSDSLKCSEVGDWYEWRFNGNLLPVQTQSIHAVQSGDYSVLVIDSNGCESAISADFPFAYTSISSQELPEIIQIIPNPSNGKFNLINVPESPHPIYIQVKSLWGHLVSATGPISLQGPTAVLDLTFLSDGVYFVEIERNKERLYRKVSIVR